MERAAAGELLRAWFAAAVDAVEPEAAVATKITVPEVSGRIALLALGKAAPAMARGAARGCGDSALGGVAVSNHVDALPAGVELIVGGHPVPDDGSLRGGRALLEVAGGLGAEDLGIALISGGGSALAEVPVPGVDLADIAATNDLLLRSGADIHQTNTIRRRLSLLKGGGLARAVAPARLITLAISDVVGDPVAVIASGPTIANDVGDEDPAALARRLGIINDLPRRIVAALGRPAAASGGPSPEHEVKVVASGSVAAHAAARAAEQAGYPAAVVDTRLSGDAAAAAGEALQRGQNSLSVFAGETTVEVIGDGAGGRNQHAALVAATLIEGRPDLFFLAGGTDGIDGTTAAAGAIVDGTTIARSRAHGLDANEFLDRSDSGTFFELLGDQVVTGPTGTNVADIWMVLRAG